MAHKKAGGSSANQLGNVAGKRLGIKVPGGGYVKSGQIIARQRGRKFVSGDNTKMGKDFTIFSITQGKVQISYKTKTKKKISVLPQ